MTCRYYLNVQPTNEAAAYLDGGALEFGPMAQAVQSETIGYKIAGTVYCVAPIVDPSTSSTLQFFAVGKDCCLHLNHFVCGTLAHNPQNEQILGGYVVPGPHTADEDGFFKNLAVDLYSFLVHGNTLHSSTWHVYHAASKAIAANMARPVSNDAVFVQLFDEPASKHDKDVLSISTKDGEYLSDTLQLTGNAEKKWYVIKGVGRWYEYFSKLLLSVLFVYPILFALNSEF